MEDQKRIAEPLRRTQRRECTISRYSAWTPDVEAAARILPEIDLCSRDLFRELATNPEGGEKRIYLAQLHGTPVAIVALRRVGKFWAPVTHYIIPGALFPVANGSAEAVIEALKVNLHLAWWRQPNAPPAFKNLRSLAAIPTYKMASDANMEDHWRRHHRHLNDVRRMRRRCEKFTIAPDDAAALEWVIRNWDAKWRRSQSPPPSDLEDRLIAAKYLATAGMHRVLVMRDGDRLIGGITFVVHHNELVAQYCYRDPEYDWHGVGLALISAAVSWARIWGYSKIDLGGSHPHHKERWAPQDGWKWELQLCPGPCYWFDKVNDLAHRASRKALRLVRHFCAE